MDPFSDDFMLSQELQAGQHEEDMSEWILSPRHPTTPTNGQIAIRQSYQPTLPPPQWTTPTNFPMAIGQPYQPTGFGTSTAFPMELPDFSRETPWGVPQTGQQQPVVTEPPLSGMQQELMQEDLRHAETRKKILRRNYAHSTFLQEEQNSYPYSDVNLDLRDVTSASTLGLPYSHMFSHKTLETNPVMNNGLAPQSLSSNLRHTQTSLQATFHPSPTNNVDAQNSTLFGDPSASLGYDDLVRSYLPTSHQQPAMEQMPFAPASYIPSNPVLNTNLLEEHTPQFLAPFQIGGAHEPFVQNVGTQLLAEAHASTPFNVDSDFNSAAYATGLSLPDNIDQPIYYAPNTTWNDTPSFPVVEQSNAPDLDVVRENPIQTRTVGAVTKVPRQHTRSGNKALALRTTNSKITKAYGALDGIQIYEGPGPDAERRKIIHQKKLPKCFACWVYRQRVCIPLVPKIACSLANMIGSVSIRRTFSAIDARASSSGCGTSRSSRATVEHSSPKSIYSPNHQIFLDGHFNEEKAVSIGRKCLCSSNKRLNKGWR